MHANKNKKKKAKNKISPTNAPDTGTDDQIELMMNNSYNDNRSKSLISKAMSEKLSAPAPTLRNVSMPNANSKLGSALISIMEEHNGDQVTTFQRQLSTFRLSNSKMNKDDRKDAFLRALSAKQRGNSVLNKITNSVTNAFDFGGKELDTRQIQKLAAADEKFSKLKRNSRIIVQITRENVAVLP